MNLIVDVGNTLIKLAVFRKHEILDHRSVSVDHFYSVVSALLEDFPKIDRGILSSVGQLPEEAIVFLQSKIRLLILSHSLHLPFQNNYKTPETLGVDRLALASAASLTYPNSNVLIIDAGTCITYDFLDREKGYMGGAISPGVAMRYKALHTFTAKLPLLHASLPQNFIGINTQDSIHVGVMEGVINEIDGFVYQYQESFNDLTTILTGGDAHFLRDSLKNDIFANSNFLLEGLNYILELNKDQC